MLCDALADPRSLAAIEAMERFADGEVDAANMVEIERAAYRAVRDIDGQPPPEGIHRSEWPRHLAAAAAFHLVAKHGKRADWCAWAVFRTSAHIQDLPGFTTDPVQKRRWSGQLRAMSRMLRDIWGNPFREPPALKKAWRTGDAASVAKQIYESREFGGMPILADALEEAGCTDADILSHLRSPGPHVRGCWVLDLILGKT